MKSGGRRRRRLGFHGCHLEVGIFVSSNLSRRNQYNHQVEVKDRLGARWRTEDLVHRLREYVFLSLMWTFRFWIFPMLSSLVPSRVMPLDDRDQTNFNNHHPTPRRPPNSSLPRSACTCCHILSIKLIDYPP